jgi:hypothetical protein
MATQTVKPNIQIGDEVREMNDAEFAQYKLDLIAYEEQAKADIAKAKQKQALLDRLGITSDEAALLIG